MSGVSSQSSRHYQGNSASGQVNAYFGDNVTNIKNQIITATTGPTTPGSRFHNKHFEVPRAPSPAFTGREEICERLHARCLPSSKPNLQPQQKRFVIHGLGGSGKTQVCLKFAEDHCEEWASPTCFDTLLILTMLQILGYILDGRKQHRELGTWLSAGG